MRIQRKVKVLLICWHHLLICVASIHASCSRWTVFPRMFASAGQVESVAPSNASTGMSHVVCTCGRREIWRAAVPGTVAVVALGDAVAAAAGEELHLFNALSARGGERGSNMTAEGTLTLLCMLIDMN